MGCARATVAVPTTGWREGGVSAALITLSYSQPARASWVQKGHPGRGPAGVVPGWEAPRPAVVPKPTTRNAWLQWPLFPEPRPRGVGAARRAESGSERGLPWPDPVCSGRH